jgi:hypothetical protein
MEALPETLALREDELPAELAVLAAAKLYELERAAQGANMTTFGRASGR